MRRQKSKSRGLMIAAGIIVTMIAVALPANLRAQDRPPERQIRAYIPPEQLVSFLPSTPFNQFIEFLNPIFQRVTGKEIVDPISSTQPIDIAIAGMHFFDAFELVLETNGLTYKETERYFIIEEAPKEEQGVNQPLAANVQGNAPAAAPEEGAAGATYDTREIHIQAVLFDVNVSKARQTGIDWNVFFGDQQSGQGGQGGGSTGGQNDQQQQERFKLKTDKLFEGLSDVIVSPKEIDFGTITQFFRLLENQGVGKTIANPSVTVMSGKQGRMQSGSDVPVQQRDFAGNTITNFFSTGIIINVTPTLIRQAVADTAGSPVVEFIHLDVQVDRSSSRPSASGPIIDRNTANTEVLLLDGEQTIIGGLYTTDQTKDRRGIPLLKDLPGWFFGLRYIFGFTTTSMVQRELLVVLQAELLDPLQARAQNRVDEDLLERFRQNTERSLRRAGEGVYETGKPIEELKKLKQQ